MSIFKVKGFDSIISKDMHLTGEMCFSGTAVIDGVFDGTSVKQTENKFSTLHVNGNVKVQDDIVVHNLTVCGSVEAQEINVEGVLSVKSGCKITANVVYYRTLNVEPGSVIMAELKHLDYVSVGEAI